MSALTPHIRVLRAEAKALQSEADDSVALAPNSTVHVLLQRLSNAKRLAAEQLETEEQELEQRIAPTPQVKGH